jgi:hypothetical protein
MPYQDEQDRLMRDLKHKENLAAIAEFCHVPASEVMDFVRGKRGFYEIASEDPDIKASTSDFHDAPEDLSDVAVAEWAAQRVAEFKGARAEGLTPRNADDRARIM